jgi:hypothetical protein
MTVRTLKTTCSKLMHWGKQCILISIVEFFPLTTNFPRTFTDPQYPTASPLKSDALDLRRGPLFLHSQLSVLNIIHYTHILHSRSIHLG